MVLVSKNCRCAVVRDIVHNHRDLPQNKDNNGHTGKDQKPLVDLDDASCRPRWNDGGYCEKALITVVSHVSLPNHSWNKAHDGLLGAGCGSCSSAEDGLRDLRDEEHVDDKSYEHHRDRKNVRQPRTDGVVAVESLLHECGQKAFPYEDES